MFGCLAFVHIHEQNRGNLDARFCKCMFLSYSSVQKGYWCYSPEKRKYLVSKDVAFIENESFFPKNPIKGENLRDDSNFGINQNQILVWINQNRILVGINLQFFGINQNKILVWINQNRIRVGINFQFLNKILVGINLHFFGIH